MAGSMALVLSSAPKIGYRIWLHDQNEWKPFGSFLDKASESHWLGHDYLTARNIYLTNLLIHLQVGEDEPWCLATNLPDREMVLRYYLHRIWIEEMFGDLKKHVFDLENTILHDFLRLSRLTLAVAYLYIWQISVGFRTIHSGQGHLVDRKDRRGLRIFQSGLRYILRRMTNASPFSIPHCSYR